MRGAVKRHKRIVAVLLALSMALSMGGAPVAASVDGDPAAQAPSTLATSISSCTTITSSGTYVLTNDITNSGASTCIRIAASDVVLDGAGYSIDGVDNSGSLGVYVYKSPSSGQGITLQNVTVTNVEVTDWEVGVQFDRVAGGTVSEVESWSNVEGVRFDVLSRDHGVYGSLLAGNTNGLTLHGGGYADVRENHFEANDAGVDVGSTSDANALVDNVFVENYDGVTVYAADGTDIRANYFEAHHSTSIILRSRTSNATVAENEIVGSQDALAGIWVDSSDNEVFGNLVVESGEHGIVVATATDNWIADNHVEATYNGLTVYTANGNEFEENTVRFTRRAIFLEDDVRENVFRNDDVANNTWAFYAAYNATSEARNLFIGDSPSPTTVSFEGHNVAVRSVASPPATPPTLDSLDKFVGTNATTGGGYLHLSVHYTDQEVNQSGVNESRLRLWRHAGNWSHVSWPNWVDTSRNTVSATVTDFGVIAPLSHRADNVSRVGFKYGDYGGNLNVEINGERRNVYRFKELDGATVGGAEVAVTNTSVSGGEQGVVEIVGSIHSFSVGGQELWIDDAEFGPASQRRALADFEILTPHQSQYVVGEWFRSSPDDVLVTVESFFWSDGTEYWGGEARPSNTSPPMSGGSGQDINTDNVNLRFDVGEIINGTSAP